MFYSNVEPTLLPTILGGGLRFLSITESKFLHMGQGFPHQLPVLENVILHPHVRRVACDDVTISRALFLYKIAFILLISGRKQ